MSQAIDDQITKSILTDFRTHFAVDGRVLWVPNGKEDLGQPHAGPSDLRNDASLKLLDLPTIGIVDPQKGRLYLIDIGSVSGPMSADCVAVLRSIFTTADIRPIFVVAYASRAEYAELLSVPTWGTVAWFADEPNHLVHFGCCNSCELIRHSAP